MKVFAYGFWDGFLEKTDHTHVQFFTDLFKLVFNSDISIGSFEESDILLESIFSDKTYLFDKKWKYSFLFSGEHRLNNYYKSYSCVLYSENNHDNIINVPLFIPDIYCCNLMNKLTENIPITKIPKKNIITIISNPNGKERNTFLNILEQIHNIDYGGRFKNNIPRITDSYLSLNLLEKISDYKFIISMEKKRG